MLCWVLVGIGWKPNDYRVFFEAQFSIFLENGQVGIITGLFSKTFEDAGTQ